jgi:hypothetical protein
VGEEVFMLKETQDKLQYSEIKEVIKVKRQWLLGVENELYSSPSARPHLF